MALRKELLKSIWYAFTALDVEKSGKVSKSQLKVRGIAGAQGRLTRHTSSDPCEPRAEAFPTGRHLTIQQPWPGVER